MQPYNILTELDAILDTRIGTIALHDPKLAIEIFKGDRYKNRFSDWFLQPNALPFDYKSAYENRGIEVLERSKMSNYIYVVKQTLAEAFINAAQGTHADPILYVNTYPYDLTEDEIAAYRRAIQEIIFEPVRIEMAYISYKDLTMNLIRQHFARLMYYNFNAWLDEQMQDIENNRMPELTVVAPAIFGGIHPKTQEEVEQLKEGMVHPFTVAILNLLPCFKLEMVDVKYYCMVDPTDVVRSTMQKTPSTT